MDWLEDVKGPDQPNNQSVAQMNQMDINDAFDKIAVESFEAVPTQQTIQTPQPASEKQKGHPYRSKKKQGKRK
jgi:hypothetical protein